MNTQHYIHHIQDLIATDKLSEALNQLRSLLENAPQLNDVLLQSGRFHDIIRQIRQGLVSFEEANVTKNQIRFGLLGLLREVEQEQSPIKRAFQDAINIVESKNVVAGSTINANVVIIGDGNTYGTTPSVAQEVQYDFNKNLTQVLVKAMKPYNDKAKKLCEDFSWLDHSDNRRKVQQFVFQNFVGEIGKQLRKLVNIGDDDLMDGAKKQKHYVGKCLDIAQRTFDLVNFTLLSVWWDTVKITPHPLNAAQHDALSLFFDNHLEHNLGTQFQLLKTLTYIFKTHEIALPFVGMAALEGQFVENSPLQASCHVLQTLKDTLNCAVAEDSLADILAQFAFLTQYRMASIKKIGYRHVRNGKPEYLHRYVALGIDIKYSEDAERGNWIRFGEQTPAILLYKGDSYQNGINLFPFIIDVNALTFEQGAKICFFSAKDLNHDSLLEYRFLGDNSVVRIEKQDMAQQNTNLNELMMNQDHLKTLNLNCVVAGFYDARNAILGKTDNLFDNL